jgi:hypothetical protein
VPIITIRLSDAALARLDRQLDKLRQDVAPLRVTRADILRRAVDLGLREMERRPRKKKQGAPPA